MKIDQHKLKRQKEVFEKWKNNNYRGTLEATTGFGKTFTAILSAKKLIVENDNLIVAVVVPTDTLRDNWRDEVKKHKIEKNCIVDTVHSLVKRKIDVDLLILDEIHRYVGDEAEVFPLIFTQINASKILGLTATLGHDGIRREMVDANCPVIDTIDLREAVKEGYVSDYIQYNLGLYLTQKERIQYKKIDNEFYRTFKHFNYDFDLVRNCLHPDNARFHASQLGWEVGAVIGTARKCMNTMRKRKEFLYGASCKIDMAEQIINKFPDLKYITFGQTTDSADQLADRFDDAMSFHSNIQTQLINASGKIVGRKCGKGKYKLHNKASTYSWKDVKKAYRGKLKRIGKDKVKKKILQDYKNNELRGLCTAKALDVGFDNADIGLAIILAGTQNQRQLIQRIGRTIRKKEGKRALIFQLYIVDTQDEKWLNNRQINTANVKTISSISQIAI